MLSRGEGTLFADLNAVTRLDCTCVSMSGRKRRVKSENFVEHTNHSCVVSARGEVSIGTCGKEGREQKRGREEQRRAQVTADRGSLFLAGRSLGKPCLLTCGTWTDYPSLRDKLMVELITRYDGRLPSHCVTRISEVGSDLELLGPTSPVAWETPIFASGHLYHTDGHERACRIHSTLR